MAKKMEPAKLKSRSGPRAHPLTVIITEAVIEEAKMEAIHLTSSACINAATSQRPGPAASPE
ncbi:hypothetical protein IQ16_00722 [Bradyrhizobium huanghuaihaiense]|uniref:Uncharacterized protein n=1 Tax=Bradyrhizobium huanghuaihaiense TaxID=990078 RepID=A0A562S5B0_9BRAD|nr:hypothetical protein [Bradyrhizobium huanghuaihaiense]TWI76481.1 hypothetical protein IQ16_00722 [Bradyrhizobium huanghuaihaiense]